MKKLYIADIRGNVIDGRISGHIVPVARNYKAVLCKDFDVRIAAGPAILNSFTHEECEILPYNVCGETTKDKWHTFINFIVLLRKASGNPIIIQQSTTLTTLLAITFLYWWTSPLYMIQYNTDALRSTIGKVINGIARWKLSGILCPTERIGKAYGTHYCIVPDYFFTNEHPYILPKEKRRWDIGIIGGITANKGTVEAVRYLATTGLKVLVAGRVCEEGLEQPLREIAASCNNIELKLGFLSDDDYLKHIRESKFCMLNYRGTYFDRSSGVVLDVLYNGTPVIGSRCEALKVVEEKNLGIVYDNLNDICIKQELTPERYSAYIESIKLFLSQQSEYKDKLLKFLQ